MLVGPDFKSAGIKGSHNISTKIHWYDRADVFRVNKEGEIVQVDAYSNDKQPGYFMRMCLVMPMTDNEDSHLRFALFHTDAPDAPLWAGSPLNGLSANAMKELLTTEGKINDTGKQFLKYFKEDCDNHRQDILEKHKHERALVDFISRREGEGVYDFGHYNMSEEIGQFSSVNEKAKHQHPFEYGFVHISDKEADDLGIPYNEQSPAELLYEIPYDKRHSCRLFASMKAPLEGEYERDRQFVPVSELGKDKELLAWQMAEDYHQIYCSKMIHRVCNTFRYDLMPNSIRNEIQEREHAVMFEFTPDNKSKERRLPNVPESQEDNQTQLGE